MNCEGRVTTVKGSPVAGATIIVADNQGNEIHRTRSGQDGRFTLNLPEAEYTIKCEHFGQKHEHKLKVERDKICEFSLPLNLELKITALECECGQTKPVPALTAGKRVRLRADFNAPQQVREYRWTLRPQLPFAQSNHEIDLVLPDHVRGLDVEVEVVEKNGTTTVVLEEQLRVLQGETHNIAGEVAVTIDPLPGPVDVRLHRTATDPTLDQALWVAIRNRTHAISFERYRQFMDRALRWDERSNLQGVVPDSMQDRIRKDLSELGINLHGVRAYNFLKLLTETFLLVECGVRIEPDRSDRHRIPFDPDEEAWRLGKRYTSQELEQRLEAYLGKHGELPYIRDVVRAAFPGLEGEGWAGRLINARINEPLLIELIWSYWMEEGMLVQTMNAVCQRFQNVRPAGDRDPLANLELDALRPLNNLIWGYISDEFNRLTVRRRAYEYDHHYGLTLYGKAAAGIRPADSRSKFLAGFHNLLYQATIFFKEDFQTTVIPDGFPLLNALQEVHLILAQGASNQFGDLPWTARVEMLLMQYMLARREMRDFLQSRVMVPYKEPWEGQVDAMKTLQGWTDAAAGHFRDLAVYGEQLLLSIRYGNWIHVNSEDAARNWGRYFRPEIQSYIHAYRAATGVDLTNPDTVDATIPGILLQPRVAAARAR